ncbi:SDR family oxidoreductase [Reichenbachiella ulvae]|uniref:SDR family oxidoreductase n=1 Tax=Reichenbachiella ulvae TaxID=2980104 RepID=A0ABT3CNC0_9BACT|nr:SDR family oxidoreductase [Reichenbachiella ulvae]MCV9385024.1 SDR family oxidoreductase [Reichenbachiella ulvae]
MMNTVLLIGATSDVAKAAARRYAKVGTNLILTSRRIVELENFAADLQIRYDVKVKLLSLDLSEFDSHEQFMKDLGSVPATSVVFAGYLGDQIEAQNHWGECQNIINSNYTGVISICNQLANQLEEKGSGVLAVFSSVAGDRGRKSNYLYGSAKAGLTAYLSGLRNRFGKTGIHVMTVKPGFMDTKMTADLDLPALLTASPDYVAETIIKAIKKKKNTVYVKWVWRYVMLIIRNIPEPIFKKLNL